MKSKHYLLSAGSTCLLLFIAVASMRMVLAHGPSSRKEAQLTPVISATQTHAELEQTYGKLPLVFEANKGETDPRVKFLAHGRGYALFLTNCEAVLELATMQPGDNGASRDQVSARVPPARAHWQRHEAVLRMKLLGANPAPFVTGVEELPGKSNYFIGNDPKKWRADVSNYARVRYEGVYPGVDLIYYGNEEQLEYDFVVAPGSDPKAITWDLESSADSKFVPVKIAANGDLVVGVHGQEIRFHKPVAYQEGSITGSISNLPSRQFVDAHYVLKSQNQVGIALSHYDPARALIIDPVIWYSTYLGGSDLDQASGIAVDGSGNVYVTGFTQSLDFPDVNQIPGACNGGCGNGNVVAFVTKINAPGTALLYSTYLGGSSFNQGYAIAADSGGNVYVTGLTESPDFPRVNQILEACRGRCGDGSNTDGFVTKISAAGDELVYSSVIGGSLNENAFGFAGIAVDGAGNAYLTGTTEGPDFPRVNQIPGACLGSCGGRNAQDGFVTKINAAGSALVYSSYVGSSGTDIGFGIAVDSSGNAYLTGLTLSSDFPRVNQIPSACNGECGNSLNYDVYVTKINAAGSALVYSSYLGGSDQDYGRGIAVDASGNAYVGGRASSTDFPAVGQIPDVCAQNSCGAFAAKINAAGNALVYSSRFGGSNGTQAHAIAVDTAGSTYLTGETQSADFPLLNQIPGACKGTCGTGANRDGFVIKINAAGTALVYSSYVGGSGDDNGGSFVGNSGIAVDSLHNAYLSGFTTSTDFPRQHTGASIRSSQTSIPGACLGRCGTPDNLDSFVMKITP